MDEAFARRYVNDGFSGGEKKRAEILQMSLLRPVMAVMDETDSGLDIDALRTVAEGINALRDSPEHGHPAHHPLPAHAELHHAGHRARALQGPHRPHRRQRAGAELEAKGYDWITNAIDAEAGLGEAVAAEGSE